MSGVLIAGLVLYPLAVHVLVLLGAPHVAVVTLVAVCALGLLLLKQHGRAALPWVALYGVLSGIALANVVTGAVFALFLPSVAVNLALMLLFGMSLRRGKIALIERLMCIEYEDDLAPPLARYARTLTWVWTLFFALTALANALLAALAPIAVWSWFANIGNFLLVALLLSVQHLYRMVRFRTYGRVMPWAIVPRLARLKPTDPAHPLFGGGRR